MCKHFVAMSEALRDVMGAENFGKYCSMMCGIQIHKDDKEVGLEIRSIGGVNNSIRVCAMIVRLAAKNVASNAGIGEQEALMMVLDDLKDYITGFDAHKVT